MNTRRPLSFLDIINVCDNFRPSASSEPLVPFLLSETSREAIGLLFPQVVAELVKDNDVRRSQGLDDAWAIQSIPDAASAVPRTVYVAFASSLDTPAARTRALRLTCTRWRDTGVFSDVIGPRLWRSEWYDVFRSAFGARSGPGIGVDPEVYADDGARNYAFSLERAACGLFGVVTYGVHMMVYERDGSDIYVWVPRRAATKPTCVSSSP